MLIAHYPDTHILVIRLAGYVGVNRTQVFSPGANDGGISRITIVVTGSHRHGSQLTANRDNGEDIQIAFRRVVESKSSILYRLVILLGN